MLVGSKRSNATALASSDYRLQSCASGPKRAVGSQWVFRHYCALELTRTRGRFSSLHSFETDRMAPRKTYGKAAENKKRVAK
jgi:hypothetical protein